MNAHPLEMVPVAARALWVGPWGEGMGRADYFFPTAPQRYSKCPSVGPWEKGWD